MSQFEQPAQTGAGPLVERRYYIDIAQPKQSAAELFDAIKCDMELFSPNLLADFRKEKGEPRSLQTGDEYHIKILGPWNGSVRVKEVADQYFELITLEGHPEAGRIRFSVRELPEPGQIRFEIHSWARARDGLVAFAYGTLGVGKQVQEQTWVTFCQRVAEASGGQPAGPVQVETVEQTGSDTHAEHHERS